jgi:hypothetical protein
MASNGKRFAVGCGAILLLMIFAGWAGCAWMKSHLGLTWSEGEIRARAAEVLPIAIPEEYEPLFSLYTNDDELQRDPLIMFHHEQGRGVESLLLLHEQKNAFSSAEAFNRINNARNGLRPSVLSEASREEWPLTIHGQDLMVIMEQGLNEEEALLRRLSVVLAWEDHHVLLFAEGPPQAVPRDLMSTLLDTL